MSLGAVLDLLRYLLAWQNGKANVMLGLIRYLTVR